ncbi:unnamed protein product [Rotaria magnacalcarata]|uniref:Uncharacterized protein n=1 Tax=Rotaria magnacalcarata TaxID=392030 RepID=A0A815Z8A9_9BILA|nr:unnamed protein product [Rotaria magnacalcarata]CAF2074204.1 unnamed protein product [Rotaria magnacalcarata]CAF2088654.1 unnamed protein product [Rotaria magnacalcarata]CAF3785292.1 unnamed protein product [Rotaria magnacalcarata]CAF3841977.1 unnamed protein product [Rotaria magnacalcarata]
MSGIDEFRLGEASQQQQQQQHSTYSFSYTDALSLSIGNMSEINVDSIVNKNRSNNTNYVMHDFKSTSLTYTIIFGFVCAFLCFLTITGNLLVLITFRRIKTVSTRKVSYDKNINMVIHEIMHDYNNVYMSVSPFQRR